MQRIKALPSLPKRPEDAHKGTFGRVLIVAGSRGMSGAAVLAGSAALRGGAGLVSIAAPKNIVPIIAGFEPSYLTIPLSEDEEGRISESASEAIRSRLSTTQAAGIGPGLGQSDELASLVSELYKEEGQPLVFDADALNLLARSPKLLTRHAGPRVLTPHPGEFARLTGRTVTSDPDERETAAAAFAAGTDTVVVLKGARSVITDGRQIAINATGNSGMATGGTGDVLTGLIASLLAQGMKPFAAAQLGAHLHGMAGDLAADQIGGRALIASDLLNWLGDAWMSIDPS